MSAETWYIRDRNKIHGPFDRAQLESLRKRGQLARFHHISQDQKTWVSASTLPDLFPASPPPRAAAPAPVPADHGAGASPVATADSREWYYSAGGAPAGPIGVDALLELAGRGAVTPDTLVWTKGFPAWVPFRDSGLAAPPGAGKPGASGVPAVDASGRLQAAAPAYSLMAYGLTYWFGFFGTALGLALMFGGTFSALGAGIRREDMTAGNTVASSGLGLLFIGACCGLAAFIMGLMRLHRAWTLIQPLRQVDPTEAGMPTPGTAIGLLFLPIFNLYWIFIAYYGLAVRTNKYLGRRMSGVPLMKERTGLLYCILFTYSLIPFLTPFASFFVVLVHFLFIVEVTRICNEIEARGA